MATYLTLWKWTEQGAKYTKGTVDRVQAFKSDVQSRGGRTSEFMWTLGQWDGFFVADVENDETLTATLLKLVGAGNVTTQTLRAFDEQEMLRILEKVG